MSYFHRRVERAAENFALLTNAEIASRIEVAELTLSQPRVRGAFRDRQLAATGQCWSDAKLVSSTEVALAALRLVASERLAA